MWWDIAELTVSEKKVRETAENRMHGTSGYYKKQLLYPPFPLVPPVPCILVTLVFCWPQHSLLPVDLYIYGSVRAADPQFPPIITARE
jgi:hypothetical protein